MKNLSKLLIVVVLLAIGNQCYAQIFRVKAGLNLSNMLYKDNDATLSDHFKMIPGFHIGATAEFPINKMFSFEPGLLLSTKGYKAEESETYQGVTSEYKANLTLYYIDIPLNAKATFDVGGVKIYGAFGPYLGIGLSGKGKTETNYMGQTESDNHDVKWGSDAENDDLKRFDFGLTFGAGAEIKSFLFGISYGLGLVNISSYTDGGTKACNRVLGISVGYKFGGK